MNLAMEVQQNLLPSDPPAVPGLDLAGRSLYCQETGGDYFDYILIWETQNDAAEKFGKERIGGILRSHHRQSTALILQAILGAIEEFRGKRPQEDDITLMVIKAKAVGA